MPTLKNQKFVKPKKKFQTKKILMMDFFSD
uniref:Uncharacterized protein n=1 Tax=viral metagenome TaxID=1070528 RepID=A0A6C0BPL9_9ZZZZ